MYRIFRLTKDGYLKDVSYVDYPTYLKAERVLKVLKKSHPKRKFKVIDFS